MKRSENAAESFPKTERHKQQGKYEEDSYVFGTLCNLMKTSFLLMAKLRKLLHVLVIEVDFAYT